jgi:hypothetical protein
MRWPRRQRSEPRNASGRHAASPRRASWTAPAAPPGAVHLGFTDGSEVDLPDNDPTALALQAVADVLVHGAPGVKQASNGPTTHNGGMTAARRTS